LANFYKMSKSACYGFRLYFLLLTFISGCSVVPADMKIADQLIETAPDSALYILQHLKPDILKSSSNRAFYGLLLVRTLDRNLLPLKPDSLLDFSIHYYLIHNDIEKLATCYLYKGRGYKYNLQYEKAMDYYLKGLDAAYLSNNEVLLGRINLDMGDIYTIQNESLLARQKYRKSYSCFTKAGYQPQAFYALLNIGRTWYTSKNYKNAQLFYRQISVFTKDSLQKGALLQEIALNYYKYHKFDSAIFYFKQSIQYPFIGNNLAIRYTNLAGLFFDLCVLDSACLYAKNAFKHHPDIRNQRECYRILGNCAYTFNDLKAFNLYMKCYQDCSDSIRKIDTQTRASILESMHNASNDVVNTKTKIGYSIVFFLLIILAVVLYSFYWVHLYKEEKLQLTKSHFKQKANIRKEVIMNHGETLIHKIDEIKLKQSAIRKKASFAEKELMDRKLYDEFLHLNDIDYFYRQMDAVLNKMVTKLQTRYPNLTQKEICWCCLHLLRIPINDIYMLLDYKVSSLKKMKQRLAQKINLTGVPQIYVFLEDILSE